jgi:phosphoribosylamine--glycine ligase
VVDALRVETGEQYKGILYGQFMLAKSSDEDRPNPKLIEFNCRFGDPEAMNVLPILSEDANFVQVCERIADGNLTSKQVGFQERATVCKYLVPSGYPESAATGEAIFVDEDAIERDRARYFYASVDVKDGQIVTTSSRTIGLVGIGDTIEEAERISEKVTSHVRGSLRHRADIGTATLIHRRIEHMQSLETRGRLINPPQAGVT